MKKIMIPISGIILLLCCSSCGSSEATQNSEVQTINSEATEIIASTESKEDQNLELAKQTYALLNETTDSCSYVSSVISVAWKWAIYDLEDAFYATRTDTLASKLKFDKAKLAKANLDANGSAKKALGYTEYKELYDFQDAVTAVIMYLQNENIYSEIDKNLNTIKENIKSISSDAPYYNALKEYYTELVNYAQFCSSPTGSYSSLSGTIGEYEKNLSKYKTDISFDLE